VGALPARCRLGGVVGGGLIQLDADSEAAFRVQPGYSGSPAVVPDGVGDAVVGMLAVTARDQDARDAYAIPVAHLVALLAGGVGERTALPLSGAVAVSR
jgi:hypothetical protein